MGWEETISKRETKKKKYIIKINKTLMTCMKEGVHALLRQDSTIFQNITDVHENPESTQPKH